MLGESSARPPAGAVPLGWAARHASPQPGLTQRATERAQNILARVSEHPWAMRLRTSTATGIIAALAMFVALGAWAVGNPVGATPDEDYHLVSIWCAHGTQPGRCEPGPTPDTRRVPEALLESDCYAHKPNVTPLCQTAPGVGDELVETNRGNFTGAYPPVFYWVLGLFVVDSLAASVMVMRFFNILLFLALTTAIYLALPEGLRRAMVTGFLVASVPLGVFLVPSINPSGWAILSAATLLVSLLGYFTAPTRGRRIALGSLATVSVLVGAGARADAALYATLAIAVALILAKAINPLRREQWPLLVLPAVLALGTVLTFLSVGQSNIIETTETGAPHINAGILLSIVFNVVSYYPGALGGWGLGWLDTGMRPFVSVGMWSVYAVVVAGALAMATVRRMLASALVVLAAIAIPTYILAAQGPEAGIQPRYLMPLLIVLAATTMVRLDGPAFTMSRGGRLVMLAVLIIANSLALNDNIRRYVTGLGGQGFNLNRDVQWWWSIPLSPLAVWFLGSIGFGVAAVLLTRNLLREAPAADQPVTAH